MERHSDLTKHLLRLKDAQYDRLCGLHALKAQSSQSLSGSSTLSAPLLPIKRSREVAGGDNMGESSNQAEHRLGSPFLEKEVFPASQQNIRIFERKLSDTGGSALKQVKREPSLRDVWGRPAIPTFFAANKRREPLIGLEKTARPKPLPASLSAKTNNPRVLVLGTPSTPLPPLDSDVCLAKRQRGLDINVKVEDRESSASHKHSIYDCLVTKVLKSKDLPVLQGNSYTIQEQMLETDNNESESESSVDESGGLTDITTDIEESPSPCCDSIKLRPFGVRPFGLRALAAGEPACYKPPVIRPVFLAPVATDDPEIERHRRVGTPSPAPPIEPYKITRAGLCDVAFPPINEEGKLWLEA
ncbi:hypothetical protein AAF712_015620 [Marasmius tenuissimus]|uniref:Uncharacterized protein n=1 Tax=Marasmius tenuissimus TaxID=585030 RepID=A0ABR2Z8V3_9AGAR